MSGGRSVDSSDIAKFKRLRKAGLSVQGIANETGWHFKTVERFLGGATKKAAPKWTKEIALEWREMMKVHKNYKKVAEECLAKDPVKYAGLTGLTVSRKLEEYEI